MRIFIGIKTSPGISALGLEFQKKFKALPVKWTHPQDLHMTLVPPWAVNETIDEVEQKITEATQGISPFVVELQKVEGGPNPQNPRLIWIRLTCPPGLDRLQKNLEHHFGPSEHVTFKPHITLARGTALKEGSELPQIEIPLTLSMKVDQIEIFESRQNIEPKYRIIRSFSLVNGAQ